MQTLIAILMTAIPQALMAIAGRLFTADLFQQILTRIILASLRHAVKLTQNTVDDDIVVEIEKRLNTPQQ